MPVRASLRPLVAATTARQRFVRAREGRQSVTQRRAAAAASVLQMRNVTARTRQPLETRDHRVPVAGGEISVRAYRPSASGLARPALAAHVFFHGGSFWLGSVTEYEPLCRWYAAAVGCVVFSVEYRLAPEFPYPTGVEDCYASYCWLARHAAELGVDPARISVGGVSAGGTMAAAVSLLARDRSGPPPLLQVLEIPATDLTMSQPSVDEFADGYVLTRASLREGYDFYTPDASRRREPYASPLLAADLSGLPPAYVLTCECDPLRDEGEAYAARLAAAGGRVSTYRAAGHVHGSTYLTRFLPSARQAVAGTCAVLATAYAAGPGDS